MKDLSKDTSLSLEVEQDENDKQGNVESIEKKAYQKPTLKKYERLYEPGLGT